ncbi:hypothetical protein D9M71_317840 [compost metagenome]
MGAELARIADGHIQVAGACAVARGRQAALADCRGAVDAGKQRTAELPVVVQALPQLTVDRVGNHQGDAAQLIHGRVQYIAAVAQHAANLTTGDHRGHVGAEVLVIDLHAVLGLVGGAGADRKAVGLVAGDQRLAGTQVDVVVAVTLLHGNADQLVERTHRFVAGIEQAVGAGAGSRQLADLLVELGNAGGQLIDLACEGGQLRVDAVVLLLHLRGNRIEPIAQRLRLGQQQLARGHVAGAGRSGLQGREERGQHRADARGAVGQQFVDRGNLIHIGGGIGVERCRRLQLVVQVAVVDAAHVGQGGAGTEEAHADILQRPGRGHRLLTGIPRGRNVGDVVTGDRQSRLAGVQPTQPDRDQIRHGSTLINS